MTYKVYETILYGFLTNVPCDKEIIRLFCLTSLLPKYIETNDELPLKF